MTDLNMLHYNATDAACTFECHNHFWADLHPDFEPAYQMTVDLYPPLMFMSTRGIKVNLDVLETTKRDIARTTDEKQLELNRLCGRELNVHSPVDCQKYFYIEKGIQPYYNEGSITVDDLALQRIARGTARRAGLVEAKLVQEIRGLRKLYGTYLDIRFDDDGRMRCSYNPRGTKFGRLSSSKTVFGTGTNIQNLPQEFKRFLVSDGIFVELDKRQAEWVVVAYLTGDANMLSVVESGEDSHIHTASLMFGLEKELLQYEAKLIGNSSDADWIAQQRAADDIVARFAPKLPRTMSGRQCGKKSNHGLNYDEGPNKFALINEMEQSEGRRIVELYHSIYPGIRLWYEQVKRQLQHNRTLTNCFGRRVHFLDAWGPDLFKAAYSMLPQSTVVDSLNAGMVRIYNDDQICGSQGANISLAAQVHDSILCDVPKNTILSPYFWELYDKMSSYVSPTIEYGGRQFKIATDMKVGLNWGAFHKVKNPTGMREVKGPAELHSALGELCGTRGT